MNESSIDKNRGCGVLCQTDISYAKWPELFQQDRTFSPSGCVAYPIRERKDDTDGSYGR